MTATANKLTLYTRSAETCPFCFVIQQQLNSAEVEYQKVVGISPNGFVPSLEYGEHFSIDHDASKFLWELYQLGVVHIFKNPEYIKELEKAYGTKN